MAKSSIQLFLEWSNSARTFILFIIVKILFIRSNFIVIIIICSLSGCWKIIRPPQTGLQSTKLLIRSLFLIYEDEDDDQDEDDDDDDDEEEDD